MRSYSVYGSHAASLGNAEGPGSPCPVVGHSRLPQAPQTRSRPLRCGRLVVQFFGFPRKSPPVQRFFGRGTRSCPQTTPFLQRSRVGSVMPRSTSATGIVGTAGPRPTQRKPAKQGLPPLAPLGRPATGSVPGPSWRFCSWPSVRLQFRYCGGAGESRVSGRSR
jgi:hypothetical protein